MDVKLEKFEGPLSLLLKLIEREEMDITEVSLAGIADQYVDFIRHSPEINPEEMADFLVIAAKLLFIKSKALLPYLFPEDEEEIEEFEQQLKMYKEFLDAAKKIEKIIGKKKFMFAREFNRRVAMAYRESSFCPPKKLKAKDLAIVFNDFMAKNKPDENLEEEILDRKINIEDKIKDIRIMVAHKIKVNFTKILKEAESKTEIIVNFLAVLELMRQKEIDLVQEELFGQITIGQLRHHH